MLASQNSTFEIPILCRWKISKEKLLAIRGNEDSAIFSDFFVIEGIPNVKYRIGITHFCKENKSALCFGLINSKEQSNININVSYKFSIPTADNIFGEKDELKTEDVHAYRTYIGTPDELFDPANNFIVNDYLTFVMEAILTVPKVKNVSNIQQSKCCKLGSKLWERDDKDFVIIVDGKEIKLHKCVISAESLVFERMIESGMQESKESKVTIIDFNFETVEKAH
uniref:BTB domain-containing protein n=1 Tax=Panagrolaimus superbus TaxID=310955 RepID=A0A914Y4B4_9BILA